MGADSIDGRADPIKRAGRLLIVAAVLIFIFGLGSLMTLQGHLQNTMEVTPVLDLSPGQQAKVCGQIVAVQDNALAAIERYMEPDVDGGENTEFAWKEWFDLEDDSGTVRINLGNRLNVIGGPTRSSVDPDDRAYVRGDEACVIGIVGDDRTSLRADTVAEHPQGFFAYHVDGTTYAATLGPLAVGFLLLGAAIMTYLRNRPEVPDTSSTYVWSTGVPFLMALVFTFVPTGATQFIDFLALYAGGAFLFCVVWLLMDRRRARMWVADETVIEVEPLDEEG